MGKIFFSAMLIMVAVFTVASGQCRPEGVVTMTKGDSVCDVAVLHGVDCAVLVKYLQVYRHAKIVDGRVDASTLEFPLPNCEQRKAIIAMLAKGAASKSEVVPKKAAAKNSVAIKPVQPARPATEFEKTTGPGMAQWINIGSDPWRGKPFAAWCMLSFSQYPGALDSIKAAFARADYVRDSLRDGDQVREMVSGHQGTIGIGRGVLVHPKNPKLVIYGNRYRIRIDSLRSADVFKPDTCDNWCWWFFNLPPKTPPPVVNTPDTGTGGDGWGLVDSSTNLTVDSNSIPSSNVNLLPSSKRKFYGDIYGWLGDARPVPYWWYGGSNFLGGMVNGFWPVGQMSGFGFGFKATGYQGWGPTPVPDTTYSDMFAGAQAGFGPVLDLRTARTRTTIAARYYLQGDWLWNQGAGKPTSQLDQLAAPELTFYAANYNWSHWVEAWVGWRQDLQTLFPNEWFAHKWPFSVDNRPTDKSVGEWGIRWYFKSLSKSNLWTLGAITQGDHMEEDHRWELAVGPTLRYKDWRMDLIWKETLESIYHLQNGGSFGFCINYDATPRSKSTFNNLHFVD